MNRRHLLPQCRRCKTFNIQHGKQNTPFVVSVGYYDNGDSGEIFISNAKAGSDIEGLARDEAILASLALQSGMSLEIMRHAITREADGTPSTIIGTVLDKLSTFVPVNQRRERPVFCENDALTFVAEFADGQVFRMPIVHGPGDDEFNLLRGVRVSRAHYWKEFGQNEPPQRAHFERDGVMLRSYGDDELRGAHKR
jgi:hypothetical protein